jgi:hypothetical protein
MGGIGSGRSGWKWKTREMLRLDILQIKKLGILRPGYFGGLSWSDGASIGLKVYEDSVQLIFRVRVQGGDWQDVTQSITTEWTSCRFGGKRPWFRCPRCGGRCYVLYGYHRFLCRRCHDLAYASQCETAQDRYFRRANKIRERLGAEPGEITIEKPPYMWWRTYDRLIDEMGRSQMVAMGIGLQRIRSMMGG